MKTATLLIVLMVPALAHAEMNDKQIIEAYDFIAKDYYARVSEPILSKIAMYEGKLKKEKNPLRVSSIRKGIALFKKELKAIDKGKAIISPQSLRPGMVGHVMNGANEVTAILKTKIDSTNAIYSVDKSRHHIWVTDRKLPPTINLSDRCMVVDEEVEHTNPIGEKIKVYKVRFVDIEKLIRMQRANKGAAESTPELQALKQELASLKKRSLAGISQEERILIIKRRKELEKRIRGLD